MNRRHGVVLAALLLLAAACDRPTTETRRPSAEQTPAARGAGLEGPDAALAKLDRSLGGGVYAGIERQGRALAIATTLPATPASIRVATRMCATASAAMDGESRVTVDARNGRLLAFKIHGDCQRVHLKARTTLWAVGA